MGNRREGVEEEDEFLTFVINCVGSTKTVKRKHWPEFIRLVRTDHGNDGEDDDRGAEAHGYKDQHRPMLLADEEGRLDQPLPRPSSDGDAVDRRYHASSPSAAAGTGGADHGDGAAMMVALCQACCEEVENQRHHHRAQPSSWIPPSTISFARSSGSSNLEEDECSAISCVSDKVS